jgi:Ca2+-binding RTX toxin-like protein
VTDGSDTLLQTEIFQFSDRTMNLEGLLNTAPSNLKLIGNVVQENKKDGQFVGDVSATDAGDTLRFELTNDAGGRFRIDRDTGKLEVANGVLLDYEQATSHTIEVLVTDSLGESIRQTFTIGIQEQHNELATGSELADVLKGGLFNDTFSGAAGNDTLVGSSGNDRLNGDAGNDSLEGGSGNDLLSAGSGNDRLIGATGKDTLTGSTGRDVFVFDDKETGSSKTKADYITDFSGRGGDRLDLKAVDADTKKRGDQKFSFIGKDDAFTKAGQVRYEKTKKETYVYLNTDSDKSAEAVIRLKGSMDLSKSWFVL